MKTVFVKGQGALCVALFVCLLTPLARAQPHTNVVFPANGQVDVATNAAIVLRGTHPIVPPAITHAWPNEEANGGIAEQPTILLIDADKSARLPRERWIKAAILGSYTFDNPRTLRFTPKVPLRMGVTYRCIVEGVRLYAPGGEVRTQPHEFEFTTARGIPTIAKSTFDSMSVVSCNQSFFITYSNIEPTTLAEAAARIRIVMQDEYGGEVVVPNSVVPHNGLRAIEIRPHGHWPVQRPITVALPWGDVTGEPRNSKLWRFVARGASRLLVEALASDGRIIPDEIRNFYGSQSQVLQSGTPLRVVSAPAFTDRWRFVQWTSADIPAISGSSAANLDVTLPCELLKQELVLTAILERVDTMRVVVALDGGGSIVVRDSSNAVIAELSDTDTLMVTDALSSFTLTALPAAGKVFSGWQTAHASMLGATGSTVVVNAKTLATAPSHGGFTPTMQPNFPNGPVSSASELYKLRALIADESPEPGFDAAQGVVFTTPTEFEEATQVERTPCVRAERCWEIVSVNDAGGGGGNVPVQAGSAEACETAWLTDPENIVTFSVRRRAIQVRVERVLLASDDATDIIPGRHLHPESYTIVERQVGNEGAQIWVPLSTTSCYTKDNIEFNTYEVRCGDLVRFRMRGSDVRGETWKMWSNLQGYAMPGGREVVGDETRYTMVVDTDIAQYNATDCSGADVRKPEVRLRACFRQQFGIDALGLRVRIMNGGTKVDASFREIWVDPLVYYDQHDDEPIDGRQLEYIPKFGTVVRVKFTTPIDVRTVFDEGMKASSYGNVNVNNTLMGNLDFNVQSFDDDHISFAPVDGSPVDIVEFRICDPTTSPRKQALHFGNILLYCKTTLKSLAGEALPTRFSFLLYSMERPGFGLFLDKAKWSHDGDNDFLFFTNYAELYNVIYGAVLTPAAAQYTDLAFQRLPDCREQQGSVPSECVYSYSDDNGYFGFSNRTLLFEPSWLGDRDYVFSHIVSYDEDCKDKGDCLVNNVYALLDAVREKTAGYQLGQEEKSQGIDWETALPDIIDLGAQFIQGLLPIDEQDEFIGQMSLMTSASELWGAAESTAPYVVRYHDNGEYVYKARLYPRRQLQF